MIGDTLNLIDDRTLSYSKSGPPDATGPLGDLLLAVLEAGGNDDSEDATEVGVARAEGLSAIGAVRGEFRWFGGRAAAAARCRRFDASPSRCVDQSRIERLLRSRSEILA